MKDFMLLFRQPPIDFKTISPKEMAVLSKKWKDWIMSIDKQERLVGPGQRLASEGKVLKAGGVITDGPFVEIRECLGSFIVVKAENLEEATTLAHGCPVLENEGSVEIRPVYP